MNQVSDPFSKWKKSENPPISDKKTSDTDLFSKWKKKFPLEGENDLEREVERNIAQQTSRIGETILGAPGDIYSFAKSLFGFSPDTVLPTSKKLREKSEDLSLGYTKPQSESEEKVGEVMQDVASFMLPGSNQYSLARNIGIPIVANLAKEGLNYAGSEKLGEAAKIGTMVVLDLMAHRKGGAKSFASNLFNESEKLIPEGAVVKSNSLEKSLSNLEKSLSSGGSAPSKEKALKKINEISSKVNKGEIEVKELVDFRKSINEIVTELGGFEVQLPKSIKKKPIANLQQVKKQVINTLDEYGSQRNPEFGRMNRSANEAWAAYENSDKLANFIKKSSKNIKSPLVKSLFGLGGGYGVITHPVAAAKLAGGIGPAAFLGYESYKILHQVIQSPTLRKYYGNVLKGAAAGNASQVSKNMKILEKNIEELDMN